VRETLIDCKVPGCFPDFSRENVTIGSYGNERSHALPQDT
jgi:hypothetical protein